MISLLADAGLPLYLKWQNLPKHSAQSSTKIT